MTESLSSNDLRVRERIDRYLRASGAGGAMSVVPLMVDASDRRYFRVVQAHGETTVMALHAGAIDFATLPFANVASLLSQIPLPIPKIIGHDDADGIVAQSDLGDVRLQAYLDVASAAERVVCYRQAVELIELLQRRGAELASDRYLPYRLAFDVEKLTWEMRFFVTHFLEAHRGASFSDIQRRALDEEWAALTSELADEPRVLCHRDYHSRNLMLHDGRLYVIDFQDARMGPDTYDLVSLLRDSYVDLPEEEVDALISYFVGLRGTQTTPLPEFRRRFDLMAVQRNLKALGTFGFQMTARGNSAYVQFMPRTLRYIRHNFERYPRFERLRSLLAAHVEELR
ncbi:MAG: phosphotransferase [Vicinamibacterales bacterium]